MTHRANGVHDDVCAFIVCVLSLAKGDLDLSKVK